MGIVVASTRWRSKGMMMIWVLMNYLSASHQQYLHGGDSRTMTRINGGQNVFIQRPFSSPPTVRAPPYYNSHKSCSVLNERENWEGNLCGDLNSGEIPMNPLGHGDFEGDLNYPFEAIKNKTLDFFRNALPVLKTYKSLPKVARYGKDPLDPYSRVRTRRDTENVSVTPPQEPTPTIEAGEVEADEGRALRLNRFGSRVKRTQKVQPFHRNTNNICENAIFCKLLNTMYDKLPQGFQRLVSQDTHKRLSHQLLHQLKSSVTPVAPNGEQLIAAETIPSVMEAEQRPPQTPCPSSAEYLTPVFARNHEGSWRYVVQIPREGYFTQTVEVTKCVQSNGLFFSCNCRTSPRWQSLLVAELYYPDAAFPLPATKVSEFNELKRQKRHTLQPQYRRRHEHPKSPVYSNTTTTTTSTSTTEIPTFGIRMKRRRRRNGSIGNIGGSSNNKVIVRNYDGGLVDSTEVHVNSQNNNKTSQSKQCDGYDEIGCYQFRLFYDWFLIPGECKCWTKSLANFYQ